MCIRDSFRTSHKAEPLAAPELDQVTVAEMAVAYVAVVVEKTVAEVSISRLILVLAVPSPVDTEAVVAMVANVVACWLA